jgi:hypothetical protein
VYCVSCRAVSGGAAMTSMETLAVQLHGVRVFVAIISDAYVQDEQCCDLFQYVRMTLNKSVLVVVVASDQQWKVSKLGLLISDEVLLQCCLFLEFALSIVYLNTK